ncbi:MAG: hypothetical protein WAM91_08175 [Candidatus Acidiferrales bacterium]
MTNADVEQMIAIFSARGRQIDRYDAGIFLKAKELFSREPQNEDAKIVIENYMHFLATGEHRVHMSEFFVGEPETDEELAARGDAKNDASRCSERGDANATP